jgi:hypothetical protein
MRDCLNPTLVDSVNIDTSRITASISTAVTYRRTVFRSTSANRSTDRNSSPASHSRSTSLTWNTRTAGNAMAVSLVPLTGTAAIAGSNEADAGGPRLVVPPLALRWSHDTGAHSNQVVPCRRRATPRTVRSPDPPGPPTRLRQPDHYETRHAPPSTTGSLSTNQTAVQFYDATSGAQSNAVASPTRRCAPPTDRPPTRGPAVHPPCNHPSPLRARLVYTPTSSSGSRRGTTSAVPRTYRRWPWAMKTCCEAKKVPPRYAESRYPK